MQSIHQDYKGALTSNGRFISISDITEENRRTTTYRCMGCGKRLFPVLGEKREHHFRHEEGAECSDYNRYLHEYAKAELKRRFDEGETFIVQYKADVKCKHYEDCKVRIGHEWKGCSKDTCTLDLKRHYDTCTPEKGFYEDLPDGKKRYVADLKLTSSVNKDFPPTILEVWVNHECTEEKKNSGSRIIEIKIDCEEDAKREITETDENRDKPIRFYGFDSFVQIEPHYTFKHLKILRGLYQPVVVTDESNCKEEIQYDPKSLFEVVVSRNNLEPRIYEEILASYGKYILREFCKYFRERKNLYGQDILTCQQSQKYRKCPCPEYLFNAEKGTAFIEGLKKHDIDFWTSNNK